MKVLIVGLLTLGVSLLPTQAMAQTPPVLITVTATYDAWGPINPDVTVKLWSDGTITTEVSPGPDPDNEQLPDGALPEGATPSLTNPDVGEFDDKEKLKEAVKKKIVQYVIAMWIKHLVEKVEDLLERAGEAIGLGDE